MKHYTIYCIIILLLGLSTPLLAQKKQLSAQKEATELLAQAKQQMGQQNYVAANKSFRQMLTIKAPLPTDMCYFFAGTLFQLGQFENSLQFIEKYRSLAGPGGEFYPESGKLKEALEKEMAIIRKCPLCDSRGYRLEACAFCEGKGNEEQSCNRCFGRKKIHCASCSGEGILIKDDLFGQKKYQTCNECEGNGIKSCTYCKGEGKLLNECKECKGQGQLPTSHLCRHGATTEASQ